MSRILHVRNRQRTRDLDLRGLRRLIVALLHQHLNITEYELCFHFVNATEMARVNGDFLQHVGSTDVITFNHAEPPLSPALHGEIFISVDDAIQQAGQFHTTWPEEMARYIVHGLLHLLGYDDLEPGLRRTMKRQENRLLKLWVRKVPLRHFERGRPRAASKSKARPRLKRATYRSSP